jgi:molybdate transport system substrate-binding protein
MRKLFPVLVIFVTSVCSNVSAEEAAVAVAANFSAPAQRLATAFGAVSGHKINLVVGSTGKLYAQIKNGAPFHVLLSADDETPTRLVKEGNGVEGSQFTYATGRLVLWSKEPGLVDAKGDVLRESFERLAIADPKLAPYGAAAMETLDKLNLRSQLQSRLVQGESIGQAYQFVATGNAALGFVALSQVMVEGRVTEGSAWVVPASFHTPLKQDAVLLQSARANAAAQAFMAYLKSEPAKVLIRGYGYEN